ncbi:hypothetical protein QE152_g26720 [Popillia japonica]|uniref:Secreted protein n=1 Tax=Popillia japonica TaxID=7064 RepID=A0AAW1JXD9_POPJA
MAEILVVRACHLHIKVGNMSYALKWCQVTLWLCCLVRDDFTEQCVQPFICLCTEIMAFKVNGTPYNIISFYRYHIFRWL